jgi:hypothetical protein
MPRRFPPEEKWNSDQKRFNPIWVSFKLALVLGWPVAYWCYGAALDIRYHAKHVPPRHSHIAGWLGVAMGWGLVWFVIYACMLAWKTRPEREAKKSRRQAEP